MVQPVMAPLADLQMGSGRVEESQEIGGILIHHEGQVHWRWAGSPSIGR